MALSKPILYSQPAFNATASHVFNFESIGGSQVVANKLVITLQSTGATIYQTKQDTYSFTHTLPANTLTNGQYYSAYIVTYDNLGNASPASASIQFYCYANPTFSFSNIPAGGIITNSNYSFKVKYNQAQGEKLQSYIINLYDAQRTQISTSGLQYATPTTPPIEVSYTFTGLNTGVNYYIQATGVTEQGTEIATNQVEIVVMYDKPTAAGAIELTNNCLGGYVIVKSNLVAITGKSNPSPPIYVDNNSAIDVTSENSYVEWSEGYNISSNFTASLWGRNFQLNKPIITLKDKSNNRLVITYRKNEEDKYYVDLTVYNSIGSKTITYYIYSNFVELTNSNANLQIWLRRINNLYEIGLYET